MFQVITEYPIALDSPDHIMPFGAYHNSSKNINFNRKLYALYNKQLKILDIGCAGGGFISDCIKDGHIAIGLEGSDCSKKSQCHEWPNIPNNLFTCDVTKPFQILYNNEPCIFDVITAWEFMEHPLEESLPMIIENIKRHLSPLGSWIMSINVATKAHVELLHTKNCSGPGTHHQNVKDINWWDTFFVKNGFKINKDKLNYFNGQFIRGPGLGCDSEATEDRMRTTSDIKLQWATINRILELK